LEKEFNLFTLEIDLRYCRSLMNIRNISDRKWNTHSVPLVKHRYITICPRLWSYSVIIG